MLSKQLYGNLASWVIIQQKVQRVPVPNGMTEEAVDVHLLSFRACPLTIILFTYSKKYKPCCSIFRELLFTTVRLDYVVASTQRVSYRNHLQAGEGGGHFTYNQITKIGCDGTPRTHASP